MPQRLVVASGVQVQVFENQGSIIALTATCFKILYINILFRLLLKNYSKLIAIAKVIAGMHASNVYSNTLLHTVFVVYRASYCLLVSFYMLLLISSYILYQWRVYRYHGATGA